MLPILIGVDLAATFLMVAWWTGIRHERAFYAILMTAVAFFYPVFAIGTDLTTLALNTSVAALFIVAAFYRYSPDRKGARPTEHLRSFSESVRKLS